MNGAICVDVGSTYTKACLVDLDAGRLVRRAEVPTTAGTDVLTGLDAAVAELDSAAPRYVCSSAGGGLRLAVIGYEALVTAEAGHRVGLSAGAQVVHVAAGRLDGAAVRVLRAARPDVILLVGGTDGGDAEVLLHNARRLAAARIRVPVVAAGNADAAGDVESVLTDRGVPVTVTGNVLPRIGVLAPEPARAAIRAVFLRHVIGGKRLSRGSRFASMVRAATPDAVLAAVELLADRTGAGVLVVDVGGATTDVYSALVPDAEAESGPRRDVAGTLWRARTVEGDLGVGVSAPGVIAAAARERLAVPDGPVALAAAAATIAVRRHAAGHAPVRGLASPRRPEDRAPAAGPAEPKVGRRDLRDVRLVVGSGGVLRHGGGDRVLDAVLGDTAGGWPIPDRAKRVVDSDYVLAAAGLLAADHPDAAHRLLNAL